MKSSTTRRTIAGAIAGLALIAALAGCAQSTESVGPCTVNDKSATSSGTSGHIKYLVYTDQCGVLTVDDAVLLNHYDSSDVYARLKKGHTYTLDTYGYRNNFTSSYPNIISALETPKADK